MSRSSAISPPLHAEVCARWSTRKGAVFSATETGCHRAASGSRGRMGLDAGRPGYLIGRCGLGRSKYPGVAVRVRWRWKPRVMLIVRRSARAAMTPSRRYMRLGRTAGQGRRQPAAYGHHPKRGRRGGDAVAAWSKGCGSGRGPAGDGHSARKASPTRVSCGQWHRLAVEQGRGRPPLTGAAEDPNRPAGRDRRAGHGQHLRSAVRHGAVPDDDLEPGRPRWPAGADGGDGVAAGPRSRREADGPVEAAVLRVGMEATLGSIRGGRAPGRTLTVLRVRAAGP